MDSPPSCAMLAYNAHALSRDWMTVTFARPEQRVLLAKSARRADMPQVSGASPEMRAQGSARSASGRANHGPPLQTDPRVRASLSEQPPAIALQRHRLFQRPGQPYP